MHRRLVSLLLLLGAAAWPVAAWSATLKVTVTHVKKTKGVVRVAVCNRQHFTQAGCRFVAHAAPRNGRATVVFKQIPPGVYAVQAYDDVNNNDRLDTNWLGWPKEGMGFSNNAPMHHGPPSYSDAAIKLVDPSGVISFKMRYF